ncbi:hypothetical protein VMCG_08656 [Cytospora schulzeri]|uniref:Uncharacterized protein n=1 Tax=Cytospora schulzeri TaxID=448051 RepID=A0A423VTI3_9PEZI|nr:hypothetical protein VMCG_08656 [Valsa malicola]
MAPDLIESVLAQMSKTGRPGAMITMNPISKPGLEPGEIASSPNTFTLSPFSRYSNEEENPMKTSDTHRKHSAVGRYPRGGPIPAPGTPQDRFAAVLGRSNNRIVPIPSGFMYPNPPITRDSNVDMRTTSSSGGRKYASSQPAIQTIPDFAAPAVCSLPIGPASETFVTNNGSNGLGGKGPTLPAPFAPATQWLSYECQRRHFNPEFKTKESRNSAGEVQYQCTVVLQDLVVQSNTQFDNLFDAKVHVADKALKQLRCKWPMAGPTRGRGHVLKAKNSNPQIIDSVRRQEELRQQLVRRPQSKSAETAQPRPMAPPSVDMSDPAQARAFVEGFKMGQVAAKRAGAGRGSSPSRVKDSETRLRTRSRSPGAHDGGPHSNGGRRHRHRSPLRDRGVTKIKSEFSSPPRYHDGSRHDPRLPSTDRYRPCRADAEDQHGRLREFGEAQ